MRPPTNTIFSISSLSGILMGSGVLLVCLLVIVRPEASAGLGPVQRLAYWSVHVGAGIVAMFVASQLIRHNLFSQLHLLASVIICGVIGTALVTPFYLFIDNVWPMSSAAEIDDWLDRLHHTGIAGSVAAEFVEALPWTMTAWLMINLPLLNPPLLNRLTNSDNGNDSYNDSDNDIDSEISLDNSVQRLQPEAQSEPVVTQTASNSKLSLVDTVERNLPHKAGTQPPVSPAVFSVADSSAMAAEANAVKTVDVPQDNTTQFLQTLPGIFGQDIVAISSDLHYLNVFTLIGKTTVLGNLRDVARELQDSGLLVHRSHWVSHNHVARIVNSGGQAACIMSNGIRVPVSRRRWRTVRDYYGKGVITRSQDTTP